MNIKMTLLDLLNYLYREVLVTLHSEDDEKLTELISTVTVLEAAAEAHNDSELIALFDDFHYVLAETSMGARAKGDSTLGDIEIRLLTFATNTQSFDPTTWLDPGRVRTAKEQSMSLDERDDPDLPVRIAAAAETWCKQFQQAWVAISEGPAEFPIAYPADLFGYRVCVRTSGFPQGTWLDVLVAQNDTIVGVRQVATWRITRTIE